MIPSDRLLNILRTTLFLVEAYMPDVPGIPALHDLRRSLNSCIDQLDDGARVRKASAKLPDISSIPGAAVPDLSE